MSFPSAVIHHSYSFHLLFPISSHPLLSVSSLSPVMQTATPPRCVKLSTSHSFISRLLAPRLPLPPLLLTSRLTRVSLGVDKKKKKMNIQVFPHILSSLSLSLTLFCPALTASPLSCHLSRCSSWTCALQECWTTCSASSPTTWSRRSAATTPPVAWRWRPCMQSCATFWSCVRKTGLVMTPIWFSTVGTHTKAPGPGRCPVRATLIFLYFLGKFLWVYEGCNPETLTLLFPCLFQLTLPFDCYITMSRPGNFIYIAYFITGNISGFTLKCIQQQAT